MRKYLLLIFVAIFALGCEKPAPQSEPQITSVRVIATPDNDNFVEVERDYYTNAFLADSEKETWAEIEIQGIDLASDKYTSATEVWIENIAYCRSYSIRTENKIVCSVGGWYYSSPGKYYVRLRKGGEDGEWTAINEDHYIMVY